MPPQDARRPAPPLEGAVLETLVNEAGDGLFIIDPSLQLVFANRRGLEMGQLTREELVGRRIDEFLDREELERRPLRVLAETPGTVVIGERLIRRKDGTTLAVEFSGRRLPDGSLLAVARDLTERNQAMSRLLVQAQALASTVSAIALSDLEGRISYVNPAFLAMWGYAREDEVLGRSATSFWVSPGDASAVMRELRERGSWMGTMRATRRDGTTFPTDLVASITVDAEGRPSGMMGSFLDATAREQDEFHIKVLTRLYAVLSGVNQAIVRSSSEAELFAEVCRVAVEFGGMRLAWIGLAADEGRSVRPVAHAGEEGGYIAQAFPPGTDMTTSQGPTGHALREGALASTEDIAEDPRMSPWREAALARGFRSSAAVPFRRAGKVAGALNLYARDPGFFTSRERALLGEIGAALTFALDARDAATAREALRAELTQAQKMESIGRLAGGVAHDFNNMLSVIHGHAELALGTLAPGMPERADLEQILDAARRSAELTRQLLAFARRQPIAPRLVKVEDEVEGSLRILRRLITEEIALSWRPDAALWPVVVDPAQLNQVLTNLVVNARDAIGGVGHIEITARNQALGREAQALHPEAQPGDYVVIAVRDDGAGMDPETVAHIFEPFFTTKSDGKGTGLGLAMVYGVARQNGGFVSVSSQVGRGTEMRVHLPRAAGAAAAGPDADAERPLPRGTERVLVVEDEEMVRALTQRLLERFGYQVVAAASPSEALRLLEAGHPRPALAVLDVVMPEMSGVQLAERIRDRFPGLPCLFVSAYPADVVSQRGLLGAGQRYLPKPFAERDLAQAVREAIDDGGVTSA